jgi:hypothetical protein
VSISIHIHPPHPPSNPQEELNSLHYLVAADVEAVIKRWNIVNIKFDSWSDIHNMAVLAFTVSGPDGQALLFKLVECRESQTAAFLSVQLGLVLADLAVLGVKVAGVAADGAANCQKALADMASKHQFIPISGWMDLMGNQSLFSPFLRLFIPGQ